MNGVRDIFVRAVLASALLCGSSLSRAFELLEIPLLVQLDPGQSFSFDFGTQGLLNTGFSIASPEQLSLSLQGQTSYFSDVGLLPDEDLQESFALYDGTLLLEVEALDPSGIRANVRTTYRMDLDPAALRADSLRARFLRQGLVRTEAAARARARAARVADVRLMRFVEGRADGRASGRWIRAVRAIDGRADLRFLPRAAPDGVLGHYGYDTAIDGNTYVWAVMDKNSKYALGVTVDRDNDGVPNVDDNCPDLANSSQANQDGDAAGDACDDDDDNDGIADAADNCPLAYNPDQADYDGDNIGNVCDRDADGDGVNDGMDACLATPVAAVVDATGCAIADLCPCENDWKNHGAYVRCVAHAAEQFLVAGLIGTSEKDATVANAGQSACGSKR
jgi:hypothetical protein